MSALCFELSMPSNRSWDGQWSGRDKYYAIVRPFPVGPKHADAAAKLVAGGPYRYAFGDGWVAQVRVKIINGKEITQARKRTAGFCGYEWMVESICRHGEIRS